MPKVAVYKVIKEIMTDRRANQPTNGPTNQPIDGHEGS